MAKPTEGWATVPVDGKGTGPVSEAARALLELSDNPRDVVWVPGANEFLVPDALAEKYRKSLHDNDKPRTRRGRKAADNG